MNTVTFTHTSHSALPGRSNNTNLTAYSTLDFIANKLMTVLSLLRTIGSRPELSLIRRRERRRWPIVIFRRRFRHDRCRGRGFESVQLLARTRPRADEAFLARGDEAVFSKFDGRESLVRNLLAHNRLNRRQLVHSRTKSRPEQLAVVAAE